MHWGRFLPHLEDWIKNPTVVEVLHAVKASYDVNLKADSNGAVIRPGTCTNVYKSTGQGGKFNGIIAALKKKCLEAKFVCLATNKIKIQVAKGSLALADV